MNVILKYSRSVNSSSLQDDAQHHDTDILAAVALSSQLGSALFRVKYSDDHASLPMLVMAWRAKTFKKALKQGWAGQAHLVADTSLQHWLDDICPICDGKGHPKVINAPTLEACTCPDCNGTGKRPLECPDGVRNLVLDAIQSLDTLERAAGGAAIRKLSDEFRSL